VSLGIRKLYQKVTKLLQRVRGHDNAISRLVSVQPTPVDPDQMATIWSNLDQLAAEIGASWPDGVTAADAVAEDRREL